MVSGVCKRALTSDQIRVSSVYFTLRLEAATRSAGGRGLLFRLSPLLGEVKQTHECFHYALKSHLQSPQNR